MTIVVDALYLQHDLCSLAAMADVPHLAAGVPRGREGHSIPIHQSVMPFPADPGLSLTPACPPPGRPGASAIGTRRAYDGPGAGE